MGERRKALDLRVRAWGQWHSMSVGLSQYQFNGLYCKDVHRRADAYASLAAACKAKLRTIGVRTDGLWLTEADFRFIEDRDMRPKKNAKNEAASEAVAPAPVEGDVIELPMQLEIDFDTTGPARE